jgi:HEAT repeat protein
MVEGRLSDKNSAVRADAATALAEMNSRQSLPALRKTLDDESEQVRFAVARAPWKMGDHSGRGFLLEVLQGEASPSTGMIRQGLDGANRKLRNPRQLALTGINEASSALLGPFSFGVKMAEQLAKDKSADSRALSASLLAFDHDPESVNKLWEALHDKSSLVRLAAAKALGQHPCSKLVPDLQELSNSDKDEIRYMAAASILRITAMSNSALQSRKSECELPNHDVRISSRAARDGPSRRE